MTRVLRVSVAVTIAAAVVGIVPTTASMLAPACAAGDVHVAVVVDAGGGGGVSSVCVPGGTRDNGATILAARASALGRPQPRFASSGLLCAIDGVPKSGCGERHGTRYAYWSYWHGTGAWSYSNIGPASTRAHADVVEGWRWQPAGAGNPTDPAPRGSANATATCVPAPPATQAPPPQQPPATGVRGAGGPPVTGGPAATGPGATVATTATGGAAANTTAPPGSGSTVTRPGQSSAPTGSSSTLVEQGVAARLPESGSGGGPPVGLIVGAVMIAALGVGGFVAARRRKRSVS